MYKVIIIKLDTEYVGVDDGSINIDNENTFGLLLKKYDDRSLNEIEEFGLIVEKKYDTDKADAIQSKILNVLDLS